MGVLRKCFQVFWSSSGWSGRSRMSKNWQFGGFGAFWWGFCYCNPTYDTFLESLEPWELSVSVSRFLVIIRMIRKVQNFQIHGIWRIWGILTRILLLQPHIWYLFGILGTIGVLRKCFHYFWSPSGWSGRPRMFKNLGFVGFGAVCECDSVSVCVTQCVCVCVNVLMCEN